MIQILRTLMLRLSNIVKDALNMVISSLKSQAEAQNNR